jgi:dolichyl-phosphate beta-glucosyltransferase
MPAYNEEVRLPRTLAEVVAFLEAQPYSSEVLVVDDGSSDATRSVVEKRKPSRLPVRLVNHPDGRNHGKGRSVCLGMMAATGDFRLFMDADNSTALDEVRQFWAHFERGCEVVVGSRALGNSRVAVHQAWYKEFAGRVGNRLIQLLAVRGIADTQAGFKMFTRQSAEFIFPRVTIDRWGFDVEVLAIARRRGMKICEVPIHWANDPGSKVRLRSYFEVLAETYKIHRNLHSGIYD